jgi:hypothetical protein
MLHKGISHWYHSLSYLRVPSCNFVAKIRSAERLFFLLLFSRLIDIILLHTINPGIIVFRFK